MGASRLGPLEAMHFFSNGNGIVAVWGKPDTHKPEPYNPRAPIHQGTRTKVRGHHERDSSPAVPITPTADPPPVQSSSGTPGTGDGGGRPPHPQDAHSPAPALACTRPQLRPDGSNPVLPRILG